jgi:hypothetical protein
MSLRTVFIVAFVSAGLTGCVSDSQYFAPEASIDAARLPAEAASAVAADMAGKLSERMGPSTGTIFLRRDGSPFGAAFEESLRRRGLSVSTEKGSAAGGVPVAYSITSLNGSIMVRLSLPSVELTRTYAISASGASPVSPLSVLQSVGEG